MVTEEVPIHKDHNLNAEDEQTDESSSNLSTSTSTMEGQSKGVTVFFKKGPPTSVLEEQQEEEETAIEEDNGNGTTTTTTDPGAARSDSMSMLALVSVDEAPSNDNSNNNNGSSVDNRSRGSNGDCIGGIPPLEDLDFDDMCEVVLSFKCRYCTFLCQDKRSLTCHIKSTHRRQQHQQPSTSTSVVTAEFRGKSMKLQLGEETEELTSSMNITSLKKQDHDVLEEHHNNLIKVEPPEEPNFTSVEETTHEVPSGSKVLGRIPAELNVASNSVAAPEPESILPSSPTRNEDQTIEDVFLCAECDVVFSSKELCCNHMHQIHDLKQFNPDFIQEEIISKKPKKNGNKSKKEAESVSVGGDEAFAVGSLPKKRKTRPPKHLTAEGGAIVPKRYRVTKEIFFTCSKCPIKFESVEVMKFHEQCHVGGNDHHPNGDLSLMEIVSGSAIKSTRKNSGGFVCPVCEAKASDEDDEDSNCNVEIFPRWGLCAGHLWREHKIDCELYSCSVCKQFKSHLITRVKEHEELHSKQAVYTCKTCSKPFKQLKQLRCHEKYHVEKMTRLPPPKESRWYTPKECHICKRILSDAKCLKKHIAAVHNKLKPFCCNVCGHMTARKAELQLHVRQHTGEKPYKCPVCPFATGDHNSLRKHKLRHSDQRPYACPYCDYRCIQSCAFKKHILAVHPGQEVVFQCQLCSHASVNEAVFTAHQKEHSRNDRLNSESRQDSADSPSDHNRLVSPGGFMHRGSKMDSTSSSKPSWLDEDSLGGVDVVDMGGVTIPASPPPRQELQEEMAEPPASGISEHSNVSMNSEKLVPIGPVGEDSHHSLPPLENDVTAGESPPPQSSSSSSDNSMEEDSIPALEAGDISAELEKVSAEAITTISRGNHEDGAGTLLGTFNVPLGTSGPILQLGQTTYILLPPNTPLPFLASNGHSSSGEEIGHQSNSNINGNGKEDLPHLNLLHEHDDELIRDALLLNTSSSSNSCETARLLENIQQLDALDLADVMTLTATNSSTSNGVCLREQQQSSSNEDSMFERLLGMSGI